MGVIALSIKYKMLDEPVKRAASSVNNDKQRLPWHQELFDVDKQTIDRQLPTYIDHRDSMLRMSLC